MTEESLGHIGLKQETGFGEEAGPPEAFAEIISETMKMDNNFLHPEGLSGARYDTEVYPGNVSASGWRVFSTALPGGSRSPPRV